MELSSFDIKIMYNLLRKDILTPSNKMSQSVHQPTYLRGKMCHLERSLRLNTVCLVPIVLLDSIFNEQGIGFRLTPLCTENAPKRKAS